MKAGALPLLVKTAQKGNLREQAGEYVLYSGLPMTINSTLTQELTKKFQSLSMGKARPNSRIKPQIYVRHSIMYENAAFCQTEMCSKASGFSPIKLF